MSPLAAHIREYMRANGLGEVEAAKRIGISQPTLNRLINASSSRPIENPSQATLQKVAAALGTTVDALLRGEYGTRVEDHRSTYSAASQALQPDLDRLGVALTAIDKALRDMHIQGRLGTLAEAVQYAYLETFNMADIHDKAQRQLYDRLVALRLRDWDGQEVGRVAKQTAFHFWNALFHLNYGYGYRQAYAAVHNDSTV